MNVELNRFHKNESKEPPFKCRVRGFLSVVADKNDPRIFLYKVPNHKWMGVTLNFAHLKAWRILCWTLLPIPLMIAVMFGLTLLLKPNNTLDWRFWSGIAGLGILFISYIVIITVYYFRMAAKDDKLK